MSWCNTHPQHCRTRGPYSRRSTSRSCNHFARTCTHLGRNDSIGNRSCWSRRHRNLSGKSRRCPRCSRNKGCSSPHSTERLGASACRTRNLRNQYKASRNCKRQTRRHQIRIRGHCCKPCQNQAGPTLATPESGSAAARACWGIGEFGGGISFWGVPLSTGRALAGKRRRRLGEYQHRLRTRGGHSPGLRDTRGPVSRTVKFQKYQESGSVLALWVS